MKHSPSFLFASIILAAFFQAGNVAAGATRMLPFLSQKTVTDSPPSTSPVFDCPSGGGFFPVSPEECFQHYYNCAGGVAYVLLCPLDSLFDPVALVCKPANEVSCNEPAFTCTADGFYPIEGECTGVYFVCASGVAYESVCPNNGIFDPDHGYCASSDTVSCAQGPTTSTTTPSTTTSTTPSTTTSTTPSTTTSTTPSTTTSTTPSTTTSTTTKSTTTTPTTTTSTTPRTTSTTTTPTTTPSGEFNCPPKDGKYPDPTDCNAYYVCISGVAFPTKCPDNGCFNATSTQCTPDCSNCINFFSGFI